MIVGLDTGLETCGWAQIDERTCRLQDLGVVIQKRTPGKLLTADRVERALAQAKELSDRLRGASVIVVEQMSFGGGVSSMVPIALSYGIALGLAASSPQSPQFLTISPQRWQREVMPDAGKKVAYDRLAARLEAHIRDRHRAAADALERIPEKHRNHALDAAALALVGALRPRACMAVVAPRPRSKRSKSLRVLEESEPVWMPREGLPPGGRDECRTGERPCRYVRCKWHLWMVDRRDRDGTTPNGERKPSVVRARWLEHPTPPCCALDIAEMRRDRELQVDRIASALGVTEDWANKLLQRALSKMRAAIEPAL